MSDDDLLCLRCRGIGHPPLECPSDFQYSTPRETLDVLEATADNAPLCDRCGSMWPDIVFLLSDRGGPDDGYGNTFETAYEVGPVAHTVLQTCCPLCRMIFMGADSMEPQDDMLNLKILLCKSWTPELLGLRRSECSPKPYAGYLVVVFHGIKGTGVFRASHMFRAFTNFSRANYITVLSGGNPDECHLAGRLVDPARIDVQAAKTWVENCAKHHGQSCAPAWRDEQRLIHLLNVHTRQIVPYPQDAKVDYVALSYVWGPAQQPLYAPGSVVSSAVKTVEDAIRITRDFGKDYVWVDSVCIDQANHVTKMEQIQLMDIIYQGAWVTLVALDGVNANAGLPRATSWSKSSLTEQPHSRGNNQWLCSAEGTTLVTVPSTLKQQISKSSWATRGWTLQEALLSPRCIYFTREQAYFECNILQASESLDDSSSPLHTSANIAPVTKELSKTMQGDFRNPFTLTSEQQGAAARPSPKDHGLAVYRWVVYIYTSRSLKEDSDAINAVSAMLNQLGALYLTAGFYWGVPREDFYLHLLWTPQNLECRLERRPDFPSWSWTGWKGPVEYRDSLFSGYRPCCRVELGVSSSTRLGETEDFPPLGGDCFPEVERVAGPEVDFIRAEEAATLTVDGVLLTFAPYPKPDGFNSLCVFNEHHKRGRKYGVEFDCLLVASKLSEDGSFFPYFLILKWVGGIAYREGLVSLGLKGSFRDEARARRFWDGCSPRRQRFFLG